MPYLDKCKKEKVAFCEAPQTNFVFPTGNLSSLVKQTKKTS